MANLQEYKCPCCGGAIAFDSTLQKMKCPFCDTEFEMDTLKGYDEELNQEPEEDMSWDTTAGGEWQEGSNPGFAPMCADPAGARLWAMTRWRLPPARSVGIPSW